METLHSRVFTLDSPVNSLKQCFKIFEGWDMFSFKRETVIQCGIQINRRQCPYTPHTSILLGTHSWLSFSKRQAQSWAQNELRQQTQPHPSNQDQSSLLAFKNAKQWKTCLSIDPNIGVSAGPLPSAFPSPKRTVPGPRSHVGKTGLEGRRRWLQFHRSPRHHSTLSLSSSAPGYSPRSGSSS